MSTPEHIAEGAGAFKAPTNPEGYPVATDQELRAMRLHGEGREFDFSEIGADRELVLHLGEGNDYLGITEQAPSKLARLRGETSKFVVTARNSDIPGSEHVLAELTE